MEKEATIEGENGDEMLRALMHLTEIHRQSGESITQFRLNPDDWDQVSQAPGAAQAIDPIEAKLLEADCHADDSVPRGTVFFDVHSGG